MKNAWWRSWRAARRCLMLPALLMVAGAAQAQGVYRCPGDVYQARPCPGGRAVAIDVRSRGIELPSASAAHGGAGDASGGPRVSGIDLAPRATMEGPSTATAPVYSVPWITVPGR